MKKRDYSQGRFDEFVNETENEYGPKYTLQLRIK